MRAPSASSGAIALRSTPVGSPRPAPPVGSPRPAAAADGTYTRLLARFAKVDVLVLDDWGLAPLTDAQRRDVLEIVEDRHGVRSTIITSQVDVKRWHDYVGEPTMADAILDRVVHNSFRIGPKGPSRRKGDRTSD